MADLKTALSTFTNGPIDTYTSIADDPGGDEIVGSHINGPLSAIIAIENDLGIGAQLKGNLSDLATRLTVMIGLDGSLRNGIIFPTSPTPVGGQLFWRSDLKELYIYDGALAQWKRIDSTNVHADLSGLSADDHAQYILADGSRAFSGELTGNLDIVGNFGFKSNTSFKMTLDHALTAARTITFPDATDTIVLAALAQTLTNKTLTTPTIADFTNSTHTHKSTAGGGAGQIAQKDEANVYTQDQTVQGVSPSLKINATSGQPYIRFLQGGTEEVLIYYHSGTDEIRFSNGVGDRARFDLVSGNFTPGGGINYASASGTDTYSGTIDPAPIAYYAGAFYFIYFANANTSATPTLNLNGLGAKTIRLEGGINLGPADIVAGHEALLRYNGTDFVLLTPAPYTNVLASDNYVYFGPGGGGSTNSTTYVKIMTVNIPIGGQFRIDFNLKTDNASFAAYGRIYRNGSAVGTERSTTSTTDVNFSEDIAGWSRGDTLEIWQKVASGGISTTNSIRIRGHRIPNSFNNFFP